jgi:hypothetical protein
MPPEVTPNPNPAELQQPVVIRGHHLRTFHEHVLLDYDLGQLVDGQERTALTGLAWWAGGYHQDVYGKGRDSVDATKTRLTSFYESVMELPDDAPVKVTEGIRDGICASCVIGAHCADEGVRESDITYLTAVRKGAERQGLLDELTELNEQVILAGKERTVSSVLLSMGALKKVLGDVHFEDPTYSNPFRRFRARRYLEQLVRKRERQS